ncbi:MAG: TIGR03747 family integrating conjugative element membrane protein [Gammaproteobacteria bacterium]|nr:TIGR03747 family integrating conjugative element membrane protein [Gammaproteobacteria bacterium]MCY4358845.1 TIGR03747 family integrating conjugative element membrane protein [Gammaproteobacteria bacterium]
MADTTDPRRQSHPGVISKVLTAVADCLKWLLLSLFFSIVVEWFGMTLWWEEQGLEHSRQLLVNELNFLGEDFNRSLLTSDPLQFASEVAEWSYRLAFQWSGVVVFIQWLESEPGADKTGLRSCIYRIYQPVSQYILASMQITQVFAVRLTVLTLATPVFGLFTLVALVDGLVRRDLRRWGGGRESSFVYHYAKKAAVPLIFSCWMLYLGLPFSLHPSWIILPFALAFAFVVTTAASTFKKYL